MVVVAGARSALPENDAVSGARPGSASSTHVARPLASVTAVHCASPRVNVTVCPAMGWFGSTEVSTSAAVKTDGMPTVAPRGARLSVRDVVWRPAAHRIVASFE